MRYRTKLLITFLATTFVINGLSLAYFYRASKSYLMFELREKVLSIAAGTAATIDGDLHNTIRTVEDETSPAYIQIRDQLRRVRNANRRDFTEVGFIYTLVPDPDNPSQLRFVVDADDTSQSSHVGDVFPFRASSVRFGEAYADEEFATDQWGTWQTAYAPIRDSNRRTVAMLGVDVSAAHIQASLYPLILIVALVSTLAIILSVTGALTLADRVSRPLLALRGTLKQIEKGDLDALAKVQTRDEFGEVSIAVNQMTAGLRERETIKSAFARYVSQQVLQSIIDSGEVPHVYGARRKVTALFCDIRGFTTLAESLGPEEVVLLLNEYFAKMVDVIFRNHGTLDKFIGDGLMVLFGAPIDDSEQEMHAVKAAVEMQAELAKLRVKWKAEGRPEIRIGVGINSGPAVVGNIGSEERMEYTAVGDSINLAARLESATKDHGVDVLISESTYSVVKDVFPARSVGTIHLKGRTEAVVAYALDLDSVRA